MTHVNTHLTQMSQYALLRNEKRKARLKQQNRMCFDFGVGDPLEPTPEFIRKKLSDSVGAVSQYPPTAGTHELREACSQWVLRRYKTQVSPLHQVLATNGSKEAVFHMPNLLFNAASPRRMVAFPDPGYPVYRSGTVLAGGVPFPYPINSSTGCVPRLPEIIPGAVTPSLAAVWVNFPHNPTGVDLTYDQAHSIYLWCLENNVILLSDECYGDVYSPGSIPPLSFLEVSKDNDFQNVLCFFSLSKRSGMTGYRSGFVAGDEKLISAYSRYRPHVGVATPTFIQAAAAAAWNEDKHVLERNEIFSKKRVLVEHFLQKNGFEFLKTTSTFFCWVKVPPEFEDGETYCNWLAQTCGVIATPGDAFGASCSGWFRLALVPSVEDTEMALSQWGHALQEHMKKI